MLQKKDNTLFFNKSSFKLAKFIFDNPSATFHIRQIERETKLSTTAIKSSVETLKKMDILTIEETALTTNIKANLESESYRSYKVVFNLYRLNICNLVGKLVSIFNNPEAIVLFGSFAKGEDIEKSDIDILIISSNKPNDEISGIISGFEKVLNRKINLHALSSLRKSREEFKNAVANGIVLHGYVKVV